MSNDKLEFNINKKLFDLIKNNNYEKFIKEIDNNKTIDLNIRDKNNNYLLNYAIIFNKLDLIKLLVSRGAKLDILDNEGRTILYVPLLYNYLDCFKLLLKLNSDSISIPLTDLKDRKNNLPIHYAIQFENIEFIKILLSNNSNLNTKNKNGYNALHLAIYTKSIEIIKLVLNSEVNINSKTNDGENSLHIACNLELYEVCKELIKKNIEINVQDKHNDFTPLHYITTINNKKITKLLLDNNADPNLQDYYGNTVLHYTIINDLSDIFTILIKHPKLDNILNVNLYNIESKIPFHYCFTNEKSNNKKYIDYLIEKTNLNIQNNKKNTGLHLLTYHNYWLNYTDILKKKKLNIFIRNNKNQRPIDNIKKKDINTFLDIVAQSYLNILKNNPNEWKNNWENICSKNINIDKLNDNDKLILKKASKTKNIELNNNVCYDIILKELNKNYKKNSNIKSFPIKKNQVCIVINNEPNINYCTFTGSLLDILFGLIYLLKNHQVCSILTKNIIGNSEIIEEYKKLNIKFSKKNFLNIEILWINKKLFLPTNFYLIINNCMKSQSRFIIIPVGIQMNSGGHANYLLYDKKTNEVERFEPHGSSIPYGFFYDPDLLDSKLKIIFEKINQNIKYFRPKDFLPKIGFQKFDSFESYCSKISDPDGFCAVWVIWYIDYRLKYYDIDRKKLVKIMIKQLKENNISFKNIIRNYSQNIISLRDEILNKENIDINDWENNNITDKQFENITNNIVNLISKLNK